MLNLAKNLLAQGLNGVYISLEMSEGIVSKRLDSMITHVGQEQLLKDMQKVAAMVENAAEKMGKFIIKRMPENRTTAASIASYLIQLEQATGFTPDFIIGDYLDIMGTIQKVSLDNLFIKDKYVTEEFRALGFDFNAIMISASQLGRFAIDAEKLNQAHIQGGISKINTSDATIAIKQDDLMRASGELYYECLKSRNSGGVGKRVLLGWDPVSLNVSSLKKSGEQLQFVKKNKALILGTGNTVFKPKDDGLSELMNN
jgi:replicative DNA helicase